MPSALPRLRGRAAARARCALLGRCRRLSCAAPRLALPRLSPRRPSLSSDAPVAPAAGRCRWDRLPRPGFERSAVPPSPEAGECGWPRAERRRRRSVGVPLGDGRPEGARCSPAAVPSRALPVASPSPFPAARGPKGCGRPRGRFPARSPRGNEESGRCSPRLSAVRLLPGARARGRGSGGAKRRRRFPGGRRRRRWVSPSGGPRVLAMPTRFPAASASGAGGGARLAGRFAFPAGAVPRGGRAGGAVSPRASGALRVAGEKPAARWRGGAPRVCGAVKGAERERGLVAVTPQPPWACVVSRSRPGGIRCPPRSGARHASPLCRGPGRARAPGPLPKDGTRGGVSPCGGRRTGARAPPPLSTLGAFRGFLFFSPLLLLRFVVCSYGRSEARARASVAPSPRETGVCFT